MWQWSRQVYITSNIKKVINCQNISSQMLFVMLRRKMLPIFNPKYGETLRKFSHFFGSGFIKIGLNFLLLIYWFIIILGTFLMLN